MDPEERGQQHQLWQLTSDGVRNFLRFVGESRAQTIERRLLPGTIFTFTNTLFMLGDATPNSPLSPNEIIGQTTPWQTTTSEDVNLVKAEQTSDLTVIWPADQELPNNIIPLQED